MKPLVGYGAIKNKKCSLTLSKSRTKKNQFYNKKIKALKQKTGQIIQLKFDGFFNSNWKTEYY